MCCYFPVPWVTNKTERTAHCHSEKHLVEVLKHRSHVCFRLTQAAGVVLPPTVVSLVHLSGVTNSGCRLPFHGIREAGRPAAWPPSSLENYWVLILEWKFQGKGWCCKAHLQLSQARFLVSKKHNVVSQITVENQTQSSRPFTFP
jgi:hypothetical protein